jgi:uncharacterized protein (DUF1501 family)
MITRRYFMRSAALAVAGSGMAPGWLLRAAAQGESRRKILIAIFQRGAADGLNVVVPYFEKTYYDLRPTIAVPAPGTKPNSAIDLDGRFGLHPSLQALKPFWDSRQLAIIHATGSPDGNRSHFEAQDAMESGMAGRTTEDGWLNRALAPVADTTSPLRAIAMGAKMPRTLRGNRGAIAIGDLQQFQAKNSEVASIIEGMYASGTQSALTKQGKGAFEAIRIIESINRIAPANRVQQYGFTEFGKALQQIARLIKADVGVEAAFADIGGWDHHTNEAPQLTGLLQQFGSSIAAFANDMGDRMEDIVLVTMSEFGRTAREDGNGGTDHGHGNVMMVLGGKVHGGKVYGRWPGLEPEQLFERRDLAVTTDYRDVLGELVAGHLGQKAEEAFPGFTSAPPLGLV